MLCVRKKISTWVDSRILYCHYLTLPCHPLFANKYNIVLLMYWITVNVKYFNVLKGCVVRVKLSSSILCFSRSPEIDISIWPEEDGDKFAEPIVTHMLKMKKFVLGMQSITNNLCVICFTYCGFRKRWKTRMFETEAWVRKQREFVDLKVQHISAKVLRQDWG